jgi:hypothetical protein
MKREKYRRRHAPLPHWDFLPYESVTLGSHIFGITKGG